MRAKTEFRSEMIPVHNTVEREVPGDTSMGMRVSASQLFTSAASVVGFFTVSVVSFRGLGLLVGGRFVN